MDDKTVKKQYSLDCLQEETSSQVESEVSVDYPSLSSAVNGNILFQEKQQGVASASTYHNMNDVTYKNMALPNTTIRDYKKPKVTFLPSQPLKSAGKRFSCAYVGAPNDPVIDLGDRRPFIDKRNHRLLPVLQTDVRMRKDKNLSNQPLTSFVSLSNYGYEPRLPGPLLKLNISGTCFLVKMNTLRKDPMVYEKILEDAEWLADTDEYYLERDPVVFRFVHSYLRYQELHLPLNICGPLLEKELEAWGLQLGFDLQRCCLGPVMESKSKLESLKKFEEVYTESTSVSKAICAKSEKWQSIREDVWRVIGDTPKKAWLNQPMASPTTSNAMPDYEDTVSNVGTATINRIMGNSNMILGGSKTQSYSKMENGDAGLREEIGVEGEVKQVSIQNSNAPFNWRNLQNTPHQIVCSRVYVTIQAIVICCLILLVILAYVAGLRIPFGPTVNLSNTNGSLPTDDFHVYRMYFAYNHKEQRVTRPVISIIILTWICVVLFTLDLITRSIFCPNIWKWIRSIYTITDILSLIPFYVEGLMYAFIAKFDNTPENSLQMIHLLEVLDIINLLKICVAGRLFRILQRQRATRVLLYTVRTSAFNMVMILELMTLSAVFFGTAIFFLDAKFDSIFQGMWWALVTMATVGYGDIVPDSIAGYIVAVICVFAGILLTSYTVPILVNDFLLYYGHADQLAWMRRVHRSATAKRRTDRRDLMAKRRISRVRALLRTTVIGSSSVTRNSNTTSAPSTQAVLE